MASFSAPQRAFISTLAGHTGLNPGVVAAWVAAEEPVGASSGYHGTQDWLNVGITDSGPMGAGNAVWRDPVQAAVATANWIKGTWSDPGFGHASSGIRGILRTVGQSPGAQISAIQNSGWASGGYSDLPSLYSTYSGQAPKPSGGGGATPVPGMGSAGSPTFQAVTKNVFDQAGFQKAKNAFTAGSFISQLDRSNPYEIPVKGEYKAPDPLLASGVLTTTPPNPQDFVSAQTTLQKIAGSSLVNVNPGTSGHGYVNPIPGAVIGRTDQGVDANLSPGKPIRALGDSKVVQITPWYQGQPLVLMQLTSGPKAGQYWYVAEQIAPQVRPGQTVRAGQTIGTYANSGTGLELGWGSPSTPHLTLATAPGHGGYSEGQVTPEGSNFRSFLGGLH